MNKTKPDKIFILHEEKSAAGSIVFYNVPDYDGLSVAFVKIDFWGYKTVYSGVQGDFHLALKKFGINYNYFPKVKGTPFPILYGAVENNEISDMKLVDSETGKEMSRFEIDTRDSFRWKKVVG